ncbi:MAG: HipA domain-containing protein [Schaalia hyovaginalis]|nr:HipA domain-containing protein [Schaalia hyovaginalis]
MLRWSDDQWVEATGSEATTHIFKPGIFALCSQALIEHLSLCSLAFTRALAPADSLFPAIAQSRFMRFAGTAAIVTTRYDRFTASDAHFYRLHQEDLRQSTSTLPHCKYEVTARDVVSVLRKTGAAGEQIDLFTQGVLLSWILAAPDAPAKNYSVVLAGNKPVLVPLYDVVTGLGQAIKYDRLRWPLAVRIACRP